MQSPSGIWIIDGAAKTVFANERMAEILGATLTTLHGKHSFDYVFPEDAAEAQRLFDAKRNGDASAFRFRLRRQDGSAVWVDIQGTPMYDVTGMIGIVGTFNVVADPDAAD